MSSLQMRLRAKPPRPRQIFSTGHRHVRVRVRAVNHLYRAIPCTNPATIECCFIRCVLYGVDEINMPNLLLYISSDAAYVANWGRKDRKEFRIGEKHLS